MAKRYKFGVNVQQTDRKAMFDFFHPIGRAPFFKPQPDGSLRHESELAGDSAIAFIDQQKGSGPFCLTASTKCLAGAFPASCKLCKTVRASCRRTNCKKPPRLASTRDSASAGRESREV